MGLRDKRRVKGGTETADEPFPEGPADDPITLLMRLPQGPAFDLDELARSGQTAHTVGAGFGSIVLDGDRTVSSCHCMLFYEDGKLCVTDSDSKNGTYVNNRRIDGDPYLVYPGNVLMLGKTRLLVCGQAREAQHADVTANSLQQFAMRLKQIYGSWRVAARHIGKSAQTLINWSHGEGEK